MLKKLCEGKRRILYTVCFFFICLIDQRVKTGSGLDGWIESFRALAGVVIAILILSHYQLKDFLKQKIPYLVWGLICIVAGGAFVCFGQPWIYFMNYRIVLAVNALLLGWAFIRTFITVVCEKNMPQMNKKFAILWLAMMVLMTISRSSYVWPLIYLLMFGCFYLTDYTQDEKNDLFHGLLNGLILAFFVLQGWCFVFRPYDRVRYLGAYGNCNMNALFYLLVLAAVLAKLIYTYRRRGNRWMKVFYWLGTGVVLDFLFLTIGRTAWIVAVVMILFLLAALCRVHEGGFRLKAFLVKGLTVVLCFVLTFPVVFCAVRYLPPVFHHPVWFWGEWEENKVHSWDKWNSEKFVDLDELMKNSVGRVAEIAESLLGIEVNDADAEEIKEGPHLEVEGINLAEEEPEISPQQQQLYDEAYAAGFALEPEGSDDPFVVRGAIYRFYFHLLNWTGHPESEQGFQIVPDHRIGHAHNIYLQYGVDFGIPAMVIFIWLVLWSGICFVKRFWRKGSECYAGEFLLLLVPALFGLLEYSWGSGSATIFILFVIWRRMICDEKGFQNL